MIVIPKRKLLDIDENKYLSMKTKADTLDALETGKSPASTIGNFTWELQIPCGKDMYPGGHGA